MHCGSSVRSIAFRPSCVCTSIACSSSRSSALRREHKSMPNERNKKPAMATSVRDDATSGLTLSQYHSYPVGAAVVGQYDVSFASRKLLAVQFDLSDAPADAMRVFD